MAKYPFKKPVRYGATKLCFALKSQAERIWRLGRSYQRKGNPEAAYKCYELAKETAKQADSVANLKESKPSISGKQVVTKHPGN